MAQWIIGCTDEENDVVKMDNKIDMDSEQAKRERFAIESILSGRRSACRLGKGLVSVVRQYDTILLIYLLSVELTQ